MNIIEAIKSGKRFKRIGWGIQEYAHFDWISQDLGDLHLRLTRDDIVADDWEVEKGPVTITEQQFNLAVQRTLHEMDPDEHGFWDKLRKNIGL